MHLYSSRTQILPALLNTESDEWKRLVSAKTPIKILKSPLYVVSEINDDFTNCFNTTSAPWEQTWERLFKKKISLVRSLFLQYLCRWHVFLSSFQGQSQTQVGVHA
jgi:hypothetical protein